MQTLNIEGFTPTLEEGLSGKALKNVKRKNRAKALKLAKGQGLVPPKETKGGEP